MPLSWKAFWLAFQEGIKRNHEGESILVPDGVDKLIATLRVTNDSTEAATALSRRYAYDDTNVFNARESGPSGRCDGALHPSVDSQIPWPRPQSRGPMAD